MIHPSTKINSTVEIGEGCIVGAGTIVIRNVADNVTYVGNPARILEVK